ncbi:hypothetical protein ACQJBY_040513 [Aegilops geniculata]
MADDDQNQQPPRYWFPYWSGPPPPVRPQMSRRLSPPEAPSSPAVPSSPRRPSPSHPHQPTAPATPPRSAHSQASSRPSPSRASPLAPIREPPPPPNTNSNAGVTARPPPKPKQKDVDVVPQPEKAAVHPTAAAETKHGKAAEHRAAHHHKEVDKEKKDEHKSKETKNHAGEDGKHKDKEKKHHADAGEESKHKEKEKDKEKKHHADAGDEGKHKDKEAKAEHGKLNGEIKAGVADMVRRATGSGHGQGASVITLAGENKGASMKVGGKSKDGSWKEHHGGHRLDGKPVDGEKKQGMMRALINSNVQVINNSLLLQSSCSGGDPGVHLKLSAKSANKDKQKHAAGADKSDKDAAAKK